MIKEIPINTILTHMHMQTPLDWTTGVTLGGTWCL